MPQEVTYLEFLYKYQRKNVVFHSIFSSIFTIRVTYRWAFMSTNSFWEFMSCYVGLNRCNHKPLDMLMFYCFLWKNNKIN